MKAIEETFHYPESWIKSIFTNDGQFRVDSMIVSGLLGAGWTSPWEIWQAYQTHLPSTILRQQWEHRTQWIPMLRGIYEEQTQRSVDVAWRRIHHPNHAWASASILGISHDPMKQEDGGILFITSSEPEAWAADGTHIKGWKRVLPPDIAMEAYWMLMCSGLTWIDIVVGLPCPKNIMQGRIIRIEKDERLQQNLFRSAEQWRENHLVKNQCPPIDASRACASFLLDRFAVGNDALRPATIQEESLIVDYEKSLEEFRMAEAKVQLLKNQLIKQVGHFGGLERPTGGQALLHRSRHQIVLQLRKRTRSNVA